MVNVLPAEGEGDVMRVETARDLGAVVRDRRAQLGLSQDSLAAAIGVTRYWVISFERGSGGAKLELVLRALSEVGLALDVAPPDAAIAAEAADALRVDLDELLAEHRTSPEDGG